MLGTMLVLVVVGSLMARRLATWQRPTPAEPEEAIGRREHAPDRHHEQPTSGSYESECLVGVRSSSRSR